MTNKRKMQRSKRAQNDTILRNKRVKYLNMQIASNIKKEAFMYDPITGWFYKADLDRIRKASDSLASLGYCTAWSDGDLIDKLLKIEAE